MRVLRNMAEGIMIDNLLNSMMSSYHTVDYIFLPPLRCGEEEDMVTGRKTDA